MTVAAQIDRVMEALWPAGSSQDASVWALLDAARDARIFSELRFSRLEYISLYAGKLPEVLQRAAPYLVELAPTYRFTRPLLEMGWGNSWGVFLRIKDARNLRHHLRGFLRVQNEAQRPLVFRYYDPRVLRVYLPTCRTDELKAVFGPIDSFITEGEQGESLIEFAFDGQRLHEYRTALMSSSSAAATAP